MDDAPWVCLIDAARERRDGVWAPLTAWEEWVGMHSSFEPLEPLDTLQRIDLLHLFHAVAAGRVIGPREDRRPFTDDEMGLTLAVLAGDRVAARALVDRLLETNFGEG